MHFRIAKEHLCTGAAIFGPCDWFAVAPLRVTEGVILNPSGDFDKREGHILRETDCLDYRAV
jgi:hypothetical protein